MTRTLWRSAGDAVVETDGVVDWSGASSDAGTGADHTVELDGYLLPAFRDAHVHTTQTGLAIEAVDLRTARSATDVLDTVAMYATANPGRTVVGAGWDESGWVDPRIPTAVELDRAAPHTSVYLARVDEHSALASTVLLEAAGVRSADGWVRLDDHHRVRHVALGSMSAADVRSAQQTALKQFASAGVARVHECAGPAISGRADLESLLALDDLVEVVATWGDLGDVSTSQDLGLRSAAGDLFCDGSIGSRTAALHAPYTDAADTTGHLYFTAPQIADHVQKCIDAGLGSGFHAIGDRAIDEVVAGYDIAARAAGASFGSVAHWIEHCEAPTPAAVATLARLGIGVSMQPQFDSIWGGRHGMYAQRFGPDRVMALNPLGVLHRAGIPMMFGSDTPVCPVDPWEVVRAAVHHHTAESRLDVDTAFACSTVPIAVGGPATFAVWSYDGRSQLHDPPPLVRLVVGGR